MQDYCAIKYAAFPLCGPIPEPPANRSWAGLMALALDAARLSGACGEIPIGAMVVDPHGEILALTGNMVEQAHDPTAHAEIVAIRQAAGKLRNNRLCDCTLIVTLEPCLMCTGAIIHSHVSGVVYGAANLSHGALISRHDVFLSPGLQNNFWFMGGVCGRECATLLHKFFTALR